MALQASHGVVCVHMAKHPPVVTGEGGTPSKLPAGAVPGSCCPLNCALTLSGGNQVGMGQSHVRECVNN